MLRKAAEQIFGFGATDHELFTRCIDDEQIAEFGGIQTETTDSARTATTDETEQAVTRTETGAVRQSRSGDALYRHYFVERNFD